MAPKIFTNSIDDVVGLGDESKSGYKEKDSPVVSALDSESDDPSSSPGGARRYALETCGKKKCAKSIYYYDNIP